MAAGAGFESGGDGCGDCYHGASGAAAYTITRLTKGMILSVKVGKIFPYYTFPISTDNSRDSYVDNYVIAKGGLQSGGISWHSIGGTWVGTAGVNGNNGSHNDDDFAPRTGTSVSITYREYTITSGVGGYYWMCGEHDEPAGPGSVKIICLG